MLQHVYSSEESERSEATGASDHVHELCVNLTEGGESSVATGVLEHVVDLYMLTRGD